MTVSHFATLNNFKSRNIKFQCVKLVTFTIIDMFLVDTMTIPLLYMSYSVRVSKLVTYHLYLKRPREANSSFNSAAISLQLAPGLISSSPLLCTSTLASQYCNIYNIKILEVFNISVSRLLNSCLFHIRSSHWLNQNTRVPPV